MGTSADPELVKKKLRNIFRKPETEESAAFPMTQRKQKKSAQSQRKSRRQEDMPAAELFWKGEAYLKEGVVSFWMTSWAPPSTMLVEETSVRTAFSCSSGIVRAPQLHMVWRTLLRVSATLSFRLPA